MLYNVSHKPQGYFHIESFFFIWSDLLYTYSPVNASPYLPNTKKTHTQNLKPPTQNHPLILSQSQPISLLCTPLLSPNSAVSLHGSFGVYSQLPALYCSMAKPIKYACSPKTGGQLIVINCKKWVKKLKKASKSLKNPN